jgi:hypothetical protein
MPIEPDHPEDLDDPGDPPIPETAKVGDIDATLDDPYATRSVIEDSGADSPFLGDTLGHDRPTVPETRPPTDDRGA